ncbi:hypothetical protein AGMMS49921_10050 [Endomicrobiia bacterium]|nr:hypothetical protein AGMMS49921_10050 [Endomicrobiia bacterium]
MGYGAGGGAGTGTGWGGAAGMMGGGWQGRGWSNQGGPQPMPPQWQHAQFPSSHHAANAAQSNTNAHHMVPPGAAAGAGASSSSSPTYITEGNWNTLKLHINGKNCSYETDSTHGIKIALRSCNNDMNDWITDGSTYYQKIDQEVKFVYTSITIPTPSTAQV